MYQSIWISVFFLCVFTCGSGIPHDPTLPLGPPTHDGVPTPQKGVRLNSFGIPGIAQCSHSSTVEIDGNCTYLEIYFCPSCVHLNLVLFLSICLSYLSLSVSLSTCLPVYLSMHMHLSIVFHVHYITVQYSPFHCIALHYMTLHKVTLHYIRVTGLQNAY